MELVTGATLTATDATDAIAAIAAIAATDAEAAGPALRIGGLRPAVQVTLSRTQTTDPEHDPPPF